MELVTWNVEWRARSQRRIVDCGMLAVGSSAEVPSCLEFQVRIEELEIQVQAQSYRRRSELVRKSLAVLDCLRICVELEDPSLQPCCAVRGRIGHPSS